MNKIKFDEKGYGVGPTGRRIHMSAIVCEDVSLAVQSARDETDINVIVKRNLQTGMLPVGAVIPMEGDFLDAVDFRESLHRVKQAETAFNSLPAELRSRFENDPAKFLDFVYSAKNRDELIKMGFDDRTLAEVIKPVVDVKAEAAKPPT